MLLDSLIHLTANLFHFHNICVIYRVLLCHSIPNLQYCHVTDAMFSGGKLRDDSEHKNTRYNQWIKLDRVFGNEFVTKRNQR